MSAPESPDWVVVGADGLIGARLLREAAHRGIRVAGTTRRPDGDPAHLRADLASGDVGDILRAAPQVVVLCAAVTGMKACRDAPGLARQVNVESPVALAGQLMARGAFVVFLSSNTVFDGSVPFPPETAPLRPANEYGAMKAEAETRLQALPEAGRQLAVVRLSKVLTRDAGMPAEFERRLLEGRPCEAFDDLRMAPVSNRFVASGLCLLAERRACGVFHLSGAAELSYAAFAREMAVHLGAGLGAVRPVGSAHLSGDVLFRPRHPALGMPATTERLGVAPQSLPDFWSDFHAEGAAGGNRARGRVSA